MSKEEQAVGLETAEKPVEGEEQSAEERFVSQFIPPAEDEEGQRPGDEAGDSGEGEDAEGEPSGAEPVEEGTEEGGEEGEPGAKAVDDRGVPWKNRAAEFKRKYEEAQAKLEAAQKPKPTEKPEDTAGQLEGELPGLKLAELTEEELEANIGSADQRKVLDKYINNVFVDRIKNMTAAVDKQRRAVFQHQQTRLTEEREAVLSAQDAYGSGDFGDLVKNVKRDDSGNVISFEWDQQSELFKRADHIYRTNPKLRARPMGIEIAASRAMAELLREKTAGGVKPTPKSKMDAATNLMGRGGSANQPTSSAVKRGGKFHRKLTDEEFDRLNPDDQDDYLVESKAQGWE